MEATKTLPNASTKLVLVVDDCKLNLTATSYALRSFGYSVNQASSGPEAISLIREHQYDLIFMDYSMPVMSGVDCTLEIRKLETVSGVREPIICFSSYETPTLEQECLDAGMDLLLGKECSINRMKEIAEKFIGSPSSVIAEK